MIKVSVIVPVYNLEKYLSRCLDSLINQTLTGIEIITVDDASPDNSISILNRYRDKYPSMITIIRSNENLRQGGARNLGLKVAKGQYIGFVDNDDWVDATMYEKLYNEAIKLDSDIVDCDNYEATEINNIIRSVVSNTKDQIGELDDEKKRKLIINNGRMFTKIFKKSLFDDNDIKFPEKSAYDDNEAMPILLASANQVAKVNECLYYYCVSGTSTSRSMNNPLCYDRLQTSINMVNHFKERKIYRLYKNEVDYRFIQLYYSNTLLVFLNRFEPPEKVSLIKIRDYMKSNYPEYRKNPYFMEQEGLWYKLITLANDISPSIAIIINILSKKVITLLPAVLGKKIRKKLL
jgi:glycosyltransferase involved in cell wall biosynthesis